MPTVRSIDVAWTAASSCLPSVLRTVSKPLSNEARWDASSPSPVRPPARVVAVSENSGLSSSDWTFTRAAANAAKPSLDGSKGDLPVCNDISGDGKPIDNIERHRPRFRSASPHSMPDRLMDAFGEKGLELLLGPLVVEECLPRAAEQRRDLRPGLRRGHVD